MPRAEDPDQVARLFDPGRDPGERVGPNDWHPGTMAELDAEDTVERRRGWYRELAVAPGPWTP